MFAILCSEKGGEQRRLEFDKPEVTIGRVQGNDIILPKGNVSKRHSRIVLKDGKFIIVDLKSTNGTYVNGRKISSPLVVKGSDKIYIGDFILSIEEGAGAGAEDQPARASMPPPPPPRRTSQPTETVPVDNQNDDGLGMGGVGGEEEEVRGPRSTQPSPMAGGPTGMERPPSPSQPSIAAPERHGTPQSPTVGMPPVVPVAPPPRQNTLTPVVPVASRLTPPPELPSRAAPEPPRPQAPPQRPTMQTGAVASPPSQPSIPPIAAPPPVAPPPPTRSPSAPSYPSPNTPAPSLQPPPTPAMPMATVPPAMGRQTAPRVVERPQGSDAVVRAAVEKLLQRLGDVEANLGRRDPALWMKAEAIATEILETWPGGVPSGVDVDEASREVVAEAVGIGPLDDMLSDETIDRITIPRGERIFVERHGVQSIHARGFSSSGGTERAARRLLARAGKSLPERGTVDAQVDGVWLTVVRLGGGVAIEARRPRALPSFGRLVEEGVLPPDAAELLEGAVRARRNILVVAPNRALRDPVIAALCRACDGDRGAVFDAAASASFGGLGWATFDVSAATVRADLGEAMRLQWDRIVLPELFGPESVDVANFLVAGHDGAIVGFQASSAEEAGVRWGELGQLHSSQTSSLALRSALGRGLHVAVEIGRTLDGKPGLLSVSEVLGGENGWELRPMFEGARPGALTATGYRPTWTDGAGGLRA